MFDQLIIGNVASDDVFGATVKSRVIKDPKKKKITKTVPFSNATYDFTKINGEIYWEQRELEYELEMIASSYEQLEEKKIAFSNFVMNLIDAEIHDPFIPDYHFIGTYESKEFNDDESGLKTTIKLKFLAYPYKVANNPKKYFVDLPIDSDITIITIENRSSHRIVPTFTVTGEVDITVFGIVSDSPSLGDVIANYTYKDTTFTDEKIAIEPGLKTFGFTNMTGLFNGDELRDCSVEISFYEEVF